MNSALDYDKLNRMYDALYGGLSAAQVKNLVRGKPPGVARPV